MLTLLRLGRWLAPLALLAGITAAGAQSTTPGQDRDRHLRGRLLLVRRGSLREGAGRDLGGLRLHRRHGREPDLRAGVGSKATGHAEAVQVTFDPAKVTYQQLRRLVLAQHRSRSMPTGQFCDTGSHYRTAIFYHGEEQKTVAEASKAGAASQGASSSRSPPRSTPPSAFYPAEDYHQDYYKKNPLRYQFYKYGCGRAQRLEQLWGKPTPPPKRRRSEVSTHPGQTLRHRRQWWTCRVLRV